MSPGADDVRELLCEYARRMTADGLVVGTSGNLSVRLPGDDGLVAVTPSGVDYATMGADDVVVVDLSGAVVSGSRRPTSELPLHLLCHARHDARAVVHTHSTAAVAVSLLHDEVPLVHYQTAMFGGPVRVAGYAPFGTPELASSVSEALSDRSAAVLAHHGTIVLDRTLTRAYDGARQLEWLCDVWLRAASAGTPRLLARGQVDEIVPRMASYGQPT